MYRRLLSFLSIYINPVMLKLAWVRLDWERFFNLHIVSATQCATVCGPQNHTKRATNTGVHAKYGRVCKYGCACALMLRGFSMAQA